MSRLLNEVREGGQGDGLGEEGFPEGRHPVAAAACLAALQNPCENDASHFLAEATEAQRG